MAKLYSLPDDITLFNILPRLRAKSLLRLKCVSKKWYSFIKAGKFANMHLKHVTNYDNNQNHQKLLVASTLIGRYTDFQTIDCEALEDGLSVTRPLPFKNMSTDYYVAILATCDGLICVGTREYECELVFSISFYIDLILWNPLTGEYKTLSKANAHKDCYVAFRTSYGLYHTSFDDDYKLLCITHDYQVYIHSLKLESWRKVEKTNMLSINTGCLYEPCSGLNKSLYFSALSAEIAALRKIIRFDRKTEKFTEIAIPSFKNQRKRFHYLSLLDVRGYIHLCVLYDIQEADSSRWSIELWRMNEDVGDWTKVLSYFWIPSSEIVGRNLPLGAAALHLTKNGSLLMFMWYEMTIYKIDTENHTNNLRNLYVSVCVYQF